MKIFLLGLLLSTSSLGSRATFTPRNFFKESGLMRRQPYTPRGRLIGRGLPNPRGKTFAESFPRAPQRSC